PPAAAVRATLHIAPVGKPGHIDSLLAAGGITLDLKALEAGRADIRWGTLARGTHRFSGARTGTIRIRLTAAGRARLEHARQLTVTVTAKVTPRTGKRA